jgi:hypothetical protein
MNDRGNSNSEEKGTASATRGELLGSVAAWGWTILAGGGGFLMLLEKGPWPLTNGWFALLSGIVACPLASRISERYAGMPISGRVRFATAAFFFVAGRIALAYS